MVSQMSKFACLKAFINGTSVPVLIKQLRYLVISMTSAKKHPLLNKPA